MKHLHLFSVFVNSAHCPHPHDFGHHFGHLFNPEVKNSKFFPVTHFGRNKNGSYEISFSESDVFKGTVSITTYRAQMDWLKKNGKKKKNIFDDAKKAISINKPQN